MAETGGNEVNSRSTSDDNSHEERLLAGRNERSYIRSRCWSTIYKATTNWVITRPLLCAPVPFRILQTIQVRRLRVWFAVFLYSTIERFECYFSFFGVRGWSDRYTRNRSVLFFERNITSTTVRRRILLFSGYSTPSSCRPIIEGASSVKTGQKKIRFFDRFNSSAVRYIRNQSF